MIKNIRQGDFISSKFAVVEKSLSQGKNGKYLRLVLGDATGRIEARIWDGAEEAGSLFDVNDVVDVEAVAVDYNGVQLNVKRISKADSYNPLDFLPASSKDIAEMWDSFRKIISGEITDIMLKKLLYSVFDDRIIEQKFKKSPAALTVHHAWIGGLLEHTLEVVQLCTFISRIYPESLNKELLIAGAMLHDLGKISEYAVSGVSFQQTDTGKLLGHPVIGCSILKQKIDSIQGFPANTAILLQHMVLSHHGKLEWGAPVKPQTIEAEMLFLCDLISARKSRFDAVTENCEKESWSAWDKFLERKVFNSG
jgi:3'-5' exoribonuclease